MTQAREQLPLCPTLFIVTLRYSQKAQLCSGHCPSLIQYRKGHPPGVQPLALCSHHSGSPLPPRTSHHIATPRMPRSYPSFKLASSRKPPQRLQTLPILSALRPSCRLLAQSPQGLPTPSTPPRPGLFFSPSSALRLDQSTETNTSPNSSQRLGTMSLLWAYVGLTQALQKFPALKHLKSDGLTPSCDCQFVSLPSPAGGVFLQSHSSLSLHWWASRPPEDPSQLPGHGHYDVFMKVPSPLEWSSLGSGHFSAFLSPASPAQTSPSTHTPRGPGAQQKLHICVEWMHRSTLESFLTPGSLHLTL